MKPFLLLATRADDAAADDEYAAFLRYTGLDEPGLVRHRLERDPLDDGDLPARLAEFSGVIVGGSPFNVTDEVKSETQVRVESELAATVAIAVEQDLPFFGACFGVGVLGALPGGVVDRAHAESPGAAALTLTEAGAADPLLRGIPTDFHAIVAHKEACRTLPQGAVHLVAGTDCPIQMFRVGSSVYATQFHPELDADSLEKRLRIYAGQGYCEQDEVERLVDAVRAVDLEPARRMLATFVSLHQR